MCECWVFILTVNLLSNLFISCTVYQISDQCGELWEYVLFQNYTEEHACTDTIVCYKEPSNEEPKQKSSHHFCLFLEFHFIVLLLFIVTKEWTATVSVLYALELQC